MGDKHHRHPVIAGVTRNLFRATATYSIHEFFLLSRQYSGRCMPAARDKKRIIYLEKKGDTPFHLRVFRSAPDHAVFSVATIKKICFDPWVNFLVVF